MIDPRAYSPVRLVPPAPLPAVSRKRLRKVLNPLPAPCECRYCGGEVKLIQNSEIYGAQYGKWPYMYICWACDAYVGLHPGTDIPLGTLANRQLRNARNAAKSAFHAVIAGFGIERDEAYENLAGKMKIPREQCHFGWFEVDQCKAAERICRTALQELPT